MKLIPRAVVQVIEPQPVLEGAGVRLKRSIATRTLNYLDPFLLFDDFGSKRSDDYVAGFPLHPHRGIETVTYVLSGEVQHRDTLGNAGSIGAGDLQWMSSGRGIMHEEMPQVRPEGLVGFQLWVNLPAKQKMSKPNYQDVRSSKIVSIAEADGANVRIIAGKVFGQEGPVRGIAADPLYLDVSVPPNARFEHAIPRDHNAFAYLFEGEARFQTSENDETLLTHPRLVIFGEGDLVRVRTGERPARFLLIAGKPLNEPVARYGPFVMNTREEIEQALEDLRRGTFVTTE
jgi:redox-sensitive bicupin YhaK (pirin superfamily)